MVPATSMVCRGHGTVCVTRVRPHLAQPAADSQHPLAAQRGKSPAKCPWGGWASSATRRGQNGLLCRQGPPPTSCPGWSLGWARCGKAGLSGRLPALVSLCTEGEGSHCPRVLLADPREHVEALKAGLAPRGKRPPHSYLRALRARPCEGAGLRPGPPLPAHPPDSPC